jgi:hypothetical protein
MFSQIKEWESSSPVRCPVRAENLPSWERLEPKIVDCYWVVFFGIKSPPFPTQLMWLACCPIFTTSSTCNPLGTW